VETGATTWILGKANMCHVSPGEDALPHTYCSPFLSGNPFPSRLQHFNTWLREHYRELQVRTDDNSPFVCEQAGCNKSFTSAGDLTRHKRIH
ncbi:C2H2-type zinc finger protein, partial [Sansalvadorimonas verongulae]|uniref:C2H2-type zinc finger protein n=1 Tax=Sansalvadorimonas verongulae TaxID=2172824 RepID=UPI0012BB5F62